MSILLAVLTVAVLGITSVSLALPESMNQPDQTAVLKNRDRAAKLPPTDSAVLMHLTSIAVLDSGQSDRTEHLFRFLRSDAAWRKYGDPHIAYDNDRQSLQVYGALTHTVDGRTVQTEPKNGYNPIVPFGLDQAPDFAHYRQMVVTHLGIEWDAVTEIAYTIRERQPFYPWAWGEIIFGSGEPILDRMLIVGAPQSEGLKVVSSEGAPVPEHWMENDRDIYGWRLKDLPARYQGEPGSKPAQVQPRISYSTCPDWKTLTDCLNERFTQAMDQQGGLAQAMAPFQTLSNTQTQIDSVITFLNDRIMRVPWDDLGMLINFRSAEKTLSRGYGSPADLAVLTAAALKVLGFDPEVSLAAETMMPLPGLTGKEGWLIHVRKGGAEALIEPASGNIHWHGPQNTTLLGIIPSGEPRVLPLGPAEANALRIDLSLTLKEDKTAEGWLMVESHGDLARYDEVRREKPEDLVKSWAGKLFASPEIKNARVTALSPDHVGLQADLKFPASTDTLGEFLRITIPWDAAGTDGLAPRGLALNYPSRDLPLFLDHTGSFEVNVNVSYPEKWQMAASPRAAEMKAEGVALQRGVSSDKNSLRVSEKVSFTGSEVSPKDWNAWRKVLLAAGKTNDRSLLLRRVEE